MSRVKMISKGSSVASTKSIINANSTVRIAPAPTTVEIQTSHAKSYPTVKRFRPSAIASGLRKYKYKPAPIINRLPFGNLVKRVIEELRKDLQLNERALTVLQDAAEGYIVGLFEDTQIAAVHSNRMRVIVRDWQLAKRIRGTAQ